MKNIFITLLVPICIFAKVHYAKVEPYETIKLKSSVSGLVSNVVVAYEGNYVDFNKVIQLEDVLEKENLKKIQISLKLVEKMLTVNQEIAVSLEKVLKRKKSKYYRYNEISTASKTQKDDAFNEFTTAKIQFLQNKEKILSFRKEILNYNHQVFKLKDTISKKSIILKNKYLYKLMVKKGDVVTVGAPLAIIYNTQKAKLTLFLLAEELENIDKKFIYIEDKKTKYKIAKIWSISDKTYMSSYRVEIYIDAPKRFSELKKVEFK